MSDNYTKVQQAFRILHPQLAGYVCQELRREYQDNWWQEVLMTLSDQTRDLPDDNGDYATLMDSLDIANCLRLFATSWRTSAVRISRRTIHGVRWTLWRACAKPLTTKLPRRSAKCCASSAMAVPKAPPMSPK